MTSAVATTSTVPWPEPIAISPERVISGSPSASTFILYPDSRTEAGLWKVEPGEFTTRLAGYREFIHIVEGAGQLIHDEGDTIDLHAGTVVALPEGWAGRWRITESLVKSYSIVSQY